MRSPILWQIHGPSSDPMWRRQESSPPILDSQGNPDPLPCDDHLLSCPALCPAQAGSAPGPSGHMPLEEAQASALTMLLKAAVAPAGRATGSAVYIQPWNSQGGWPGKAKHPPAWTKDHLCPSQPGLGLAWARGCLRGCQSTLLTRSQDLRGAASRPWAHQAG